MIAGPRLIYSKRRWFIKTQAAGLYPITPQAVVVLLVLMGRRAATWEELSDAVWPDADAIPDTFYDVLKACTCQLNRILRPQGWSIRMLRSTSGQWSGVLQLQEVVVLTEQRSAA